MTAHKGNSEIQKLDTKNECLEFDILRKPSYTFRPSSSWMESANPDTTLEPIYENPSGTIEPIAVVDELSVSEQSFEENFPVKFSSPIDSMQSSIGILESPEASLKKE